MPSSHPADKQKEEAFYNMWEYYRDTYGYKPRHFSIDSMSLEDIQSVVKELDAYHDAGYYKQDREAEEEEMAYYDMLDKYKDDEYAQEAEPHENDFYDTMDFSKDKGKLRDFPVVKEQRGGAVMIDTGDQSSAPVVDPHASFDDEEESDEEFADRISYTKKLTDEDPYRSVKSFDYDAAYDDDQDEFAGSTEEKFFSAKAPPRNPAKSLPLTDDDPYADFDSFDDYKKDRDSKMKTEVKKMKITKSGLQKMVQKLVKEQIGVEREDPGLLVDSIEEDLISVSSELGDIIKQLQSKQAYVSVMIRALDSTEFGGKTDMSAGGTSNPSVALDKGADALKGLFAEYGYSDLSARIKKFLETTY